MFLRSIIILVLSLSWYVSISQTARKKFTALSSITGTWSMETKKGMLYEVWKKVNDSTLSGRSFRVNGQDTVILEQINLVLRNNIIKYIPVVKDQNNQQPVPFTLLPSADTVYIFENKEHDFPQRVIYMLPQDNSLHAWIEGTINAQPRRSDFYYKKAD